MRASLTMVLLLTPLSPRSTVAQAARPAAPTPRQLTAQLVSGGVQLSWIGPALLPPGLTYLVFRSVAPNPTPALASPHAMAVTSYLDRGLFPSALSTLTVMYQVAATLPNGTRGLSEPVAITVPPASLLAAAPRTSQVDIPVHLMLSSNGADAGFAGFNLDIQAQVGAPFPNGASIEISNLSQPSRSVAPVPFNWNGSVYFHRYPIGNATGLSIEVTVKGTDTNHTLHLGNAHFTN